MWVLPGGRQSGVLFSAGQRLKLSRVRINATESAKNLLRDNFGMTDAEKRVGVGVGVILVRPTDRANLVLVGKRYAGRGFVALNCREV